MAYRNVSTPRFYVNSLEFLSSNGIMPFSDFTYMDTVTGSGYNSLNPSATNILNLNELNDGRNAVTLYNLSGLPCNFAFLLGHNIRTMLNTTGNEGGFPALYPTFSPSGNEIPLRSGGVNDNNDGWTYHPEYDGFSSLLFDEIAADTITVAFAGTGTGTLNLNAIVIGMYYDMPHSPDLSLKLNFERGSSHHQKTMTGASFSNTIWDKPPSWGNLGPWELWSATDYESREAVVPSTLYKKGRRSWDLKFSYLDDGDIWGPNQMLGDYLDPSTTLDDGDENDGYFQYNLLTDDNFFSQVWHKTLGGNLPFIFQPDAPVLNETTGLYEGGNNNPDQFAICKFKESSLKAKQSAHGVYDVSLVIEEVW